MKKLFLATLLCWATTAHAQWMWNPDKMNEIKGHIDSPAYSAAYEGLISDADKAMTRGPWSVTFKVGKAPSGDPHDYVSLSRYSWPDPSKEDGLPYIYRDGESNPELENFDRNPLGEMAEAVKTLSLAWFYSGDERYARRAVEVLRVWFLDPKTRMNPHLEYAQFVPGQNGGKGRPFGLIDTYSLVEMVSAVKLLEGSKSYTPRDKKGMERWFGEFKRWWQTSPQGLAESRGTNNHGLAWDVQLVAWSLFVGDRATALDVIWEFPSRRMFAQIEPDGSQPAELRRTLAFHYSAYNLRFMVDMAAMAANLGVDVVTMRSDDGRSLYGAIDFLTPYLGKELESWPYKQISGWGEAQQAFCRELARVSAIDPRRTDYRTLAQKHGKAGSADRERLLYGVADPVAKAFDFAAGQFAYAMKETDKALDADAASPAPKGLVSPRTLENGKLKLVPSRDWTSGFFPGSLWLMYEYTGDEAWRQAARKYTAPIEREKTNGGTHDLGFMMFNSFGNGLRLTGDEEYKKIVLESARTLATRYQPGAGIIRSWDHNRNLWRCPVIIDNMMNLELLFWAFHQNGDSTLYNIALSHARNTMKNHFRDDYGSWHVLDYDPATGEVLQKGTHQGYTDSSTWARGEAWGLYGFTMCYRETGLREFLDHATHIADFIFSNPNLPADLVPYWDYDAPAIPDEPRDASAAAITASALYELSTMETPDAAKYRQWADTITDNLLAHYTAKSGGDGGFVLLHSTGFKPAGSEIDVPISYADYYFLEAMLRRHKLEK